MITKANVSIGILTLFTMIGCGKKKSDDSSAGITILPQMLRIAATNAKLVEDGQPKIGLVATTETFSTDVTISSLKYPISSISLSDVPTSGTVTATATGNTNFNVYECTGTTAADCMVDLNGTALQNLVKSTVGMPAKIGTFTQININMCPGTTTAAAT